MRNPDILSESLGHPQQDPWAFCPPISSPASMKLGKGMIYLQTGIWVSVMSGLLEHGALWAEHLGKSLHLLHSIVRIK